MATDNMAGLFTTPEQYQQAQRQQALASGMEMAKLSPVERAAAMGYAGAAQVGQGIAGMMGVEDPMMKQQAAIQQLAGQFDTGTSKGLADFANSLRELQLYGPAAQVAAQVAPLRLKEAEATAKLREQLPAVAKLQSYRDRLVAAGAPQADVDAVNAAIKSEGEGKGTKVSVGVSTGENAYGTAFGKGIADQDLAKYSLAQKAPEILATADTTEKLLQSDKVFTGTGASAKLNLLALGQGLGVTGKNADEIIANTQQLQQQRSQAVLNQIKSSGLGTGQGFTDKDLKFLQDSAAGSITLSKETLQRQINVERKVARAATKDWNSRLGSMPQKVVGPMGLSSVELPAQTAFDSVEEANAAKLPKGTAITVGGRKAIVE
jgi:hypothetical protein